MRRPQRCAVAHGEDAPILDQDAPVLMVRHAVLPRGGEGIGGEGEGLAQESVVMRAP
jgi:hypothetical protein